MLMVIRKVRGCSKSSHEPMESSVPGRWPGQQSAWWWTLGGASLAWGTMGCCHGDSDTFGGKCGLLPDNKATDSKSVVLKVWTPGFLKGFPGGPQQKRRNHLSVLISVIHQGVRGPRHEKVWEPILQVMCTMIWYISGGTEGEGSPGSPAPPVGNSSGHLKSSVSHEALRQWGQYRAGCRWMGSPARGFVPCCTPPGWGSTQNIDTQSSIYVCSITLIRCMFMSINHLTNHLSTDKDLCFSLPAYVHVCIEQVWRWLTCSSLNTILLKKNCRYSFA